MRESRTHARLTIPAILGLILSLFVGLHAAPAAAAAGTRQIALAGTTSFAGAIFDPSQGTDTAEFPAQEEEEASAAAFDGVIDRSLSRGSGTGAATATARKAKSNPGLQTSFEGLNFYQQRYSRNGNQFSVEPPDQALCVGNGFVVEGVNDVLNVFNTSGASALPDNTSTNVVATSPRNVNHAVDLNTFYKYPAAINRATFVRGPQLTDPICLFDVATNRFFVVVLTLETVPATGAFTLVNHLDIAVSQTGDPTGLWNIYKIDVTADGSHNTDPNNACPCIGDYPHIGADANGIYLTTNAYPWNGDGFNGAQIYALSKAQLAAGAASVTMQHIDTWGAVAAASDAGATQPGFTVWPAQSPSAASFNLSAGGTEYFLSSNAADEATHPVAGFGGTYVGNQIVAWALTNTASLNSAAPALSLSNAVLAVGTYAIPPKAKQKGSGAAPGVNAPQGYCLNDTTTVTVAGTGCWRLLVTAAAHARGPEVISTLDASDTRMQQVMYANGKIWGALDTAVTVGGENRAGIAYYVVKADTSLGALSAKIALQGIVGLEHSDLIYPAIGVTESGRGVVAMTLTGDNDYPSAAYAAIDAKAGMGDVHVIAAGAAPQDGFTGYRQQVARLRPRWGDYGAAAVDGDSIWIASEYIAQSCDYTAWGGPFFAGGSGDNLLGTCGGASRGPGARGALGNWSTRISKLTP